MYNQVVELVVMMLKFKMDTILKIKILYKKNHIKIMFINIMIKILWHINYYLQENKIKSFINNKKKSKRKP